MHRRKRFLFITPPGYGHIFPMVPLGWALRALGCDVLVGTCGVSLSAATRAGISATNLAPNVNLQELFARFRDGYRNAFYNPDMEEPQQHTPIAHEETFFTVLGDMMVDRLVCVIDEWRPDVIVYTPYAAAAPIAAARYDLPSVFLGLAIAYTPKAMFNSTYCRMSRTCERHGVHRIPSPGLWIDVAPTSLRQISSDGTPMRPISYTGADLMDPQAVYTGGPQVVVTLGTVVPVADGLKSLTWLVNAAPRVAAEFVIALGRADTDVLGKLPPNVRASSWINLDRLMPSTCAVIHHGGPGTMFAALNAGVPQLVIPQGSDQFYNAEALRRRGVALVPKPDSLGPEMIDCLLHEPDLREAAGEVSAELSRMPAPANVASEVVALAG